MPLIPNKQYIVDNCHRKCKNPGLFYHANKRALDVLGAGLGLVVSSPLLLLVYVLVKLDSRGPVLFKQERVGHNKNIFGMYKFRTMRSTHETDENDLKITAIGKLLRKYSLDELPQFINVLKGEMSLVGPRPEVVHKVDHYQDWQCQRFDVKPGLSGLWQVLGRKDVPLLENIEMDIYYLNNRSTLLDLSILAKTPFVVIKGKGAY